MSFIHSFKQDKVTSFIGIAQWNQKRKKHLKQRLNVINFMLTQVQRFYNVKWFQVKCPFVNFLQIYNTLLGARKTTFYETDLTTVKFWSLVLIDGVQILEIVKTENGLCSMQYEL